MCYNYFGDQNEKRLYKYEYIKSVPKTLIGKVNYRKLEEECAKKYSKVK